MVRVTGAVMMIVFQVDVSIAWGVLAALYIIVVPIVTEAAGVFHQLKETRTSISTVTISASTGRTRASIASPVSAASGGGGGCDSHIIARPANPIPPGATVMIPLKDSSRERTFCSIDVADVSHMHDHQNGITLVSFTAAADSEPNVNDDASLTEPVFP